MDKHSTSPQVKHQLDLPRNSAFLTDVSLLVAEKILCLAGKIGKFDKISTLDRHCLFAPLCLEVRRDASSDFSRNVFKVLKSSPVDRGATETCYASGTLEILSRTIHTANKTKFFLQVHCIPPQAHHFHSIMRRCSL